MLRLHADRLAPIIIGHWQEAAHAWQTLRGQALTSDFVEAWRAAEGKLAWLAYVATAFLEGLSAPGSARPIVPNAVLERQAELYARLAFLVFECVHWLRDARRASMDCGAPAAWIECERTHALGERFQIAALNLCHELHLVSTCDSAETPPSVRFLQVLTQQMRVDAGGAGLLEGLVVQAFTDLGEWTHSEVVIDRVLVLLETLSTGLKIVYLPTALPRVYSNGKLLLDSAFVQSALHTASPDGTKFAFLNAPVFVRAGHARRRFWHTLARLFFMQPEAVVAANFDAFISPIAALRTHIEQLAAAAAASASSGADAAVVHGDLVSRIECVLRDARGLIQVCV